MRHKKKTTNKTIAFSSRIQYRLGEKLRACIVYINVVCSDYAALYRIYGTQNYSRQVQSTEERKKK